MNLNDVWRQKIPIFGSPRFSRITFRNRRDRERTGDGARRGEGEGGQRRRQAHEVYVNNEGGNEYVGAVAALMAGATVVEGLSENNSVSPRESPSGHPIIVKCLPTTSRFGLKQMKSDACPRTMRPAINLTRRGKSMSPHASIFRLLINPPCPGTPRRCCRSIIRLSLQGVPRCCPVMKRAARVYRRGTGDNYAAPFPSDFSLGAVIRSLPRFIADARATISSAPFVRRFLAPLLGSIEHATAEIRLRCVC